MIKMYRCPVCHNNQLEKNNKVLYCNCGKKFDFYEKTQIPIFDQCPQNSNEYTVQNAVELYDNFLAWLYKTFHTTEKDFREIFTNFLDIKPKQKILITGAGTGSDISSIYEKLDGKGEIHVQDYAANMLLEAQKRYTHLETKDLSLFFSLSDATELPFISNYFDRVFHFGAINVFSDVKKGIHEMHRVVKNNGKVLFGDEGIAPWLINSEYAKMIIENSRFYAVPIPLDLLPFSINDVRVTWLLENTFYLISFIKDEKFPTIDSNVKHIGVRGGSMQSRYFGKLEGINQDLRDKLYEKCKEQGFSKVQGIENAISDYLEKLKNK